MTDKDLMTCHIVFVALYLRGGPRSFAPSRRKWTFVQQVIRSAAPSLGEAATCLSNSGAWQEAGVLSQPGLLAWAERVAPSALTPLSAFYPSRWLLAPSIAPPAVWVRGTPPLAPLVGVVGSRAVPGAVARFCRQVGAEAVSLGHAVVSGGANGSDTFAVDGALRAGGEAMRILPCGLDAVRPGSTCDVSACAPGDTFSTAAAMERNALIYAASQVSVVAHARLREGGAWHGATDAIRRRLCRVIVRDDPASSAHRALVALGAWPMSVPADLSALVDAVASSGQLRHQGALFAA